MLPSIKKIMEIKDVDRDTAKLVRRILECKDRGSWLDLMNNHINSDNLTFKLMATGTLQWFDSCYNRPCFVQSKLTSIDYLIGTYGVEFIPKGHNERSPSIDYCNTGDSDGTTMMFISGRGYRVGCWGDIVERGNYD